MRFFFIIFCLIQLQFTGLSQIDFYKNYTFSKADTLRGMLRPERTCFDVKYYDLNIKVDPERKFIEGYVDVFYKVVEDFDVLQIDLYENMKIKKIVSEKISLDYKRMFNAVFITIPQQKTGDFNSFRVYYEGNPTKALVPPWDGGFVWSKDEDGNHWIGVACEGDGASLWWPNKDHLSDEPDSMSIRVAVPQPYTCVSNGNLRSTHSQSKGYKRFDWFVSYPINNYNVTLNIAKYAHFSDTYTAEDGEELQLDYYVLPYHLEKAKTHFQSVHQTLKSFEHYFGKYPFWNDGYALVETPYLGMEHQSAIAYGNQYQRGYLGGMIPRNMDWDYIIVHETGHEYWGNSISCNDLSEMWIHESFTTYMEALYVEYTYSKKEALKYLSIFRGRPNILNEQPILGPKDVNWEDWTGSDHYFKGSWMLHTLRHAINDDELWFDILKSFYQKHALSNIETNDFVDYVNDRTGFDFIEPFFEQYLQYPNIPTFEYKLTQKENDLIINYRWKNCISAFNMPLLVGKRGNYGQINPTTYWKKATIKNMKKREFKIAEELFLIDTKN